MPRCSSCHHDNPARVMTCERCGTVLERDGGGRSSGPLSGPLAERVRSLLDQGRKIEAIKIYREATGAGLKEAKDAVEALEVGRAARDLGAPMETRLLDLLRQGKRIEAIKVHRAVTGSDLRAAKDVIDALCAKHGIEHGRSGCLPLLLLLTFSLAGLGAYFRI